MAKFTLAAAPTFKLTVNIPVAGGDELELDGVFNHRDLDELRAAEKESREAQEQAREAGDAVKELKAMAGFILFIMHSWPIDEPLDDLNVIKACVNYPRFFDSVTMAYTRELWCLREKR